MPHIEGYEIDRRIYRSSKSQVFRALRKEDGRRVVLKVLRPDCPALEEIARYKHEYSVLDRLKDLEGVIKSYGLQERHNSLVLVLEDFGARSLDKLIASRRLSLNEFLDMAILIVQAVGDIHSANVVHKNINPSNIALNPQTRQLKIIDFGISTALSREVQTVRNPEVLEGDLAYIAPEQTGRMNRSIDYRSDYYSLGATFYEMLTGRPPFEGSDPLKLAHCHIAKTPDPPHLIRPEIPKVVSGFVMKLLAKNQEDRYQSASGIKADLQEFLRRNQSIGRIESFTLGAKDVPERLALPQKLYSREQACETLMAAFGQAVREGHETVFVIGPAGIGKTVLVNEVSKQVIEQGAHFLSGKFDQRKQNIPYSAIAEAFRELIRSLLTESRDQLDRWRANLTAELGALGKVILDVIPELELVIGPQAPVEDLAADESQNRFIILFRKFITALCKPDHPLVLFLDDLQWADSASLRLLETMINSADTHWLLLIGTYRADELRPSDPLTAMLERLRTESKPFTTIEVTPLSQEDIGTLIRDAFRCDANLSVSLRELVFNKTRGNPFFAKEFLKSLYVHELLNFDVHLGGWTWDPARIGAQALPDNVLQLIADGIRRMGNDAQQMLSRAALLGNRFELNGLSIVSEQSPSEVLNALREAVSEGLVIPLGDAYKVLNGQTPVEAQSSEMEYCFAHDRVQQAAYSMIPDSERAALHRTFGLALLRNSYGSKLETRFFDIMNHLNLGIGSIESEQEKNELIQLNLMAGVKAGASAAYGPAVEYFRVALGLLPADSWSSRYDLTLHLYTRAVEAAYLTSNFDLMEELADVALENAGALLDKVPIYQTRIKALGAMHKPNEAVRTALDLLRALGVKFPDRPNKLHVLGALIRAKLALAGKSTDDLLSLRRMNDPRALAAMRVMCSFSYSLFQAYPQLYPIQVVKSLLLTLEYGTCPESIPALTGYGLILAGYKGDIDSGFKFGALATKLRERLNAREFEAREVVAKNLTIRHWKEPLRDTLSPLLDAYQSGLEVGDLEFGGLGLMGYLYHSYWAGRNLVDVERDIVSHIGTFERLGRKTAVHMMSLYRQAILNLLGHASDPCKLSGDAYDETTELPICRQANDGHHLYTASLHKLILGYLFRDYELGLQSAGVARNYLPAVIATCPVVPYYFYDSLVRLATYESATPADQKRINNAVVSNQKKLRKWAHHAPCNCLQKFWLVEAERLRALRKDSEAPDAYDRAIRYAQENRYIQDQALANELCGEFHIGRGRTATGAVFLQEAVRCYVEWGAMAKVRELRQRRPYLIGEHAGIILDAAVEEPGSPGHLSFQKSEALDLASVLKASQAISSEIVLEKLLATSLSIVMENAGAQKGFLVLESRGKMLIEAEAATNGTEVEVLRSLPVEECQEISPAIVNYVARTLETVVLNDGAAQTKFSGDPYIVEKKPKSMACIPLIHQGKLLGALYLENNLSANAFAPDRVEILRLLGSQAAISLDNSRLYQQQAEYSKTLQAEVENRTSELRDNLELLHQENKARARVEDALRESENRYRTIFETTGTAMVILDDKGLVSLANCEAERLTGYTKQELLGKVTWSDSVAESEVDRLRNYRERRLREPESAPKSYETQLVDQSGRTKHVYVTVDSIPERREIVASLIDISERKRAEEALRQAKEAAESATRAKGEFLANMSHEIRTPLYAVSGMIDLMLDSELNSRQLERARIAKAAANTLLSLINDILDLSKIEAGRLDLEEIDFDIRFVFSNAESLLAVRANGKNLALKYEIDEAVPHCLRGDPNRLQQVLLNLGANAVKFTEEGNITFLVELQEQSDDEVVLHFSVSDTGIGIAPDKRQAIFDRFSQADPSTTRKYGGAGLGLAISCQLSRAMGGDMWVESEPGKGSVFHFTVRLRLGDSGDTAPVSNQSPVSKTGEFFGLRVLLAEDNAFNQAVAVEVLKKQGCVVVVAANGREAVELFDPEKFDIVLMDLQMPELDGYEATRIIRAKETSTRIPIIAQTAHAFAEDRKECLAVGMDEFLSKPITVAELLKVFKRFAPRGRYGGFSELRPLS